MAIGCPHCGAKNPTGSRFCSKCGRTVIPASEQQEVIRQQIQESLLTRYPHREGTGRGPGLAFPILLIATGACAITASSLILNDLDGRSPIVRELCLSLAFQAYVVAALGIGMMIRSMMPRPERATPLLRRADSPVASAVSYLTSLNGAVKGKRLGTGVRTMLYFFSVLSPLVGSVAGSILYASDEPDYQRVGRTCIILTVVLLIVTTVVGALLYIAFGVPD
jgi:hypothetical protein